MKYSIRHKTTYNYSAPVHQSYHLLHLSPREVPHQTVVSRRITISPRSQLDWTGTDYFGNPFGILNLSTEHTCLIVDSEAVIEVVPQSLPKLDATAPWELLAEGRAVNAEFTQKDVWQFAAASRHGRHVPDLAAYARTSFPGGCPVMVGVQDLTRRIFEDFTFDATATDVSTPVEAVFKARRGVCQDFAHLQIAALRTLNLPARYVSGYIMTHPPEGQQKLQGADASHAWISVWAPETGWVDFDPTNNVIPHGEHITIAYGRDFDDVCPISGVLLGGGAHTVDAAVDVIPMLGPEGTGSPNDTARSGNPAPV